MAEELTALPKVQIPSAHAVAPALALARDARGMNLPNKLTVARFFLTVVFLGLFFAPFRYNDSFALFVFAAASLTDYFDGKIARRDNLITNFGILMDPLADKILICSGFIAFV